MCLVSGRTGCILGLVATGSTEHLRQLHEECVGALREYIHQAEKTCELLRSIPEFPLSMEHRLAVLEQRLAEMPPTTDTNSHGKSCSGGQQNDVPSIMSADTSKKCSASPASAPHTPPTADRLIAVLCTLLIRPSGILRSAIVMKPATLLHLHQIRC